jgi:general secretion pathway protein D
MKTQSMKWQQMLGGILVFLLCAAPEIHAQERGGFRPFGFFGGFNNNNGSSSSSYNNNGTVGSATFSVDPDTHNIIINADAETFQQISNVIYHLDQPIPQVLLNCVFLEVQHNNSSDIGVEGGWTGGAGNSQVSAANIFGLSGLNSVATNFNALGQPLSSGFPTPLSTSTLGSGGLYQILGSDFQATLRAIAQAGKAQLLSRPSVLARDGQPAEIVVGQDVPLVSGVSYYTSGGSTVPIINTTYTDVGIILDVTPYIGQNGYVQMILQPQISSVDSTLSQTIAPGVSAPYLDVRSANTVVITPNGQTVVIGGLMENDKNSSNSKIPILGDIPLLGNLFKSSNKSDSKSELLIFVTPHIVRAPEELPALTSSVSQQNSLVTNSVSERELDQFLERVPVKKNP